MGGCSSKDVASTAIPATPRGDMSKSPSTLPGTPAPPPMQVKKKGPLRPVWTSPRSPANKSDYVLNCTFKDGPNEKIKIATKDQFLSLLQQKARAPASFHLLDTQSRANYNRQALKFAMNVWRGIPSIDIASENIVNDMRKRVRESVQAGCTILLYSNEDNYTKDIPLNGFISEVLLKCESQFDKIVILGESFMSFCETYPHTFVNSSASLPGPTEILHKPKEGFCLMVSETRTIRSNLETVRDIMEVKYVINLDDNTLSDTALGQAFTALKDMPFIEGRESRGSYYRRIVTDLHEISTFGCPTLVSDFSGEGDAIVVVCWYMIELGWTVDEVINYILFKRGRFTKVDILADDKVLKALNTLASKLADGSDIEIARGAAAAVFPEPEAE